jgi:hypothetical protein
MKDIEICEKQKRKDPRKNKKLDYRKNCRREERLENGKVIKKHHRKNFNMFDGLSVKDALSLSDDILDREDE